MILTLIIFESITKAILSEGNFQNSNLKFENIDIESVLDIKCNIGGKKTRKKKKKKKKKRRKQTTIFYFVNFVNNVTYC